MSKKSVVIFICVIFLIFACTACTSVGDQLVSKKDISLVKDWNSPTIIKPISCYLHKGEKVEVVDVSTLSLGSSNTEKILQVSSLEQNCIGWSFPNQFK